MQQIPEQELLVAQQRIAELEAREQELTDFIENGVIGLHWVDKNGIIIWVNKAELDLLGYSKDEYIGHHIAEFHVNQHAIEDILNRLSSNETIFNYEAQLRCKDGSIKTVLISSNVLRKDGEFIHTRCFTRDITHYKQAQKEPKEWKNPYETFIKASGQLMYERNVLTDVVVYGGDVERILGFSIEEMGTDLNSWIKLIHPEDLPRFNQIIRSITGSKPSTSIEYRVRSKNGQYISVEDKGYFFFEKGKLVRAIGVITDITQHKIIERELREQHEIVETINHIGQLLSAELDLEKLLQALTDAATELVGANFGSFFYNVIDDSGESYFLYTLSGVEKEKFSHFPMPRNTEVFAPTFRGEGVVRSDDIRLDPRYGKNTPYHGIPPGHLPVASYLAVPVVSRSGEVLGGLFFGHPETGVFTARDEQILTGLASQAAIAIDNARLYKQAQEANKFKDEIINQLKTNQQELERMAAIVESSNDPIMSQTLEGIILSCNKSAQQLYGYTSKEMCDRHISLLFPKEYLSDIPKLLMPLYRGEAITNFETLNIAKSGTPLEVAFTAFPVKDIAGEIIGTSVIIRDLTERKRMERERNKLLKNMGGTGNLQ